MCVFFSLLPQFRLMSASLVPLDDANDNSGAHFLQGDGDNSYLYSQPFPMTTLITSSPSVTR